MTLPVRLDSLASGREFETALSRRRGTVLQAGRQNVSCHFDGMEGFTGVPVRGDLLVYALPEKPAVPETRRRKGRRRYPRGEAHVEHVLHLALSRPGIGRWRHAVLFWRKHRCINPSGHNQAPTWHGLEKYHHCSCGETTVSCDAERK